jgi:AcrR family transcriptional regulator
VVIKHSSPKQRARTDQAKVVRREQLLEVVAQLWTEKNFASITMFEVAKRANLAKGTTYLYFQTKEELLLALLKRELENWFLDAQRIFANCYQKFGATPSFHALGLHSSQHSRAQH